MCSLAAAVITVVVVRVWTARAPGTEAGRSRVMPALTTQRRDSEPRRDEGLGGRDASEALALSETSHTR